MLLELRAENYAVIDRAVATFGPGLNLMTGETGANHERNPGPHRIQFPHVAKVTEVREPHTAIAKYSAGLSQIKRRPRQRQWAIADQEQNH